MLEDSDDNTNSTLFASSDDNDSKASDSLEGDAGFGTKKRPSIRKRVSRRWSVAGTHTVQANEANNLKQTSSAPDLTHELPGIPF